MDIASFSTAGYVRLQQQVDTLLKMNATLKEELAIWKPTFAVQANDEQETMSFTCKYGRDGYQQSYTVKELSGAPPEVLASMLNNFASHCASLRTKVIAETVRPALQKAADYSAVKQKGK